MQPSHSLRRKKNLLLAFDAFGTLFHPKQPIHHQYELCAERHGIKTKNSRYKVQDTFKTAFKEESKLHPNYGRSTGLGAEKWWSNVITRTFTPFLMPSQTVPKPLIHDLLTRFSTQEGYALYPDVLPFFRMLREVNAQSKTAARSSGAWPWEKTVVGVVTNSDDRVPGVLESFGLRVGARRVGSGARRSGEEEDVRFVVLSYDVGVEKPDRGVFDAASALLGDVLAEDRMRSVSLGSEEEFEKLCVGDSLKHDYLGARRAGWHGLLLDRSGQQGGERLVHEDVVKVPMEVEDEQGGVRTEEVETIRDLGALRSWRAGTRS